MIRVFQLTTVTAATSLKQQMLMTVFFLISFEFLTFLRCWILKGKPVFFNTSEHSTNGKLHLNYLEHTTSSFWENKKEKTCQNEFDAIIPRIWRKLNLKAISFEFYSPCIGFAFPFLLLTENMLNLTWYF